MTNNGISKEKHDVTSDIQKGGSFNQGIQDFPDDEAGEEREKEKLRREVLEIKTELRLKENQLKNLEGGTGERVSVQEVVKKIRSSYLDDGAPPPRPYIKLPWDNVNEALGNGLYPGAYLLVGNTGAGKSQWALQAAWYAAKSTDKGVPKEQTPVLYIALELEEEQLTYRLAGIIENHHWSKFWKGEFGGDTATRTKNIGKLHRALEEIEQLPIEIVTGKAMGWPYNKMAQLIKEMKEKHGKPPLVVLDFTQLASSPEGKREDVRERIGNVSYEARTAAKDYGATIILISSTARAAYGALNGVTDNKNTELPWEKAATSYVGLGKESGETEFSADGVFVMAREPWKDKTPPPEGTSVHFGIAKLRYDKAGEWVEMKFNGNEFLTAPQREQSRKGRSLT